MTDLLIGTTNPGKVREYADLLAALSGVRLLSLRDIGLGDMDVPEPHDTYEPNARDKAVAYARASGLLTLADDSGLEVDALGGRPGVLSARYAGPGASAEDRYFRLLGELAATPDDARTARFVCVIVIARPTGETASARGTVEGRIAREPMPGETGFGYDPVFIPNGYTVSMAQVGAAVKARIDHRGNAARAILPTLTAWAAAPA